MDTLPRYDDLEKHFNASSAIIDVSFNIKKTLNYNLTKYKQYYR